LIYKKVEGVRDPRGRKVHISRGRLIMIRSRAPNGGDQPYLQQPISISLFSNFLAYKASPSFWENLPEEVQRRFSYQNLRWKC